MPEDREIIHEAAGTNQKETRLSPRSEKWLSISRPVFGYYVTAQMEFRGTRALWDRSPKNNRKSKRSQPC